MPMRPHVRPVVVRSVVVVSGRDDFSALDHDGPEGEAHGTLRRGVGTLREVKLGLVHGGL